MRCHLVEICDRNESRARRHLVSIVFVSDSGGRKSGFKSSFSLSLELIKA